MTINVDTLREVDIDGQSFFVPVFWSDNAAYIVARKYARVKDGLPEVSVKQILWRIATNIFLEDGFYSSALYEAMFCQRVAFNSPVWFNLGLEKEPVLSACFILQAQDNVGSIVQAWGNSARIFKQGAGVGIDLSNLREKGAPIRGKPNSASGPLPLLMNVLDAAARSMRSGGTTRRAAVMFTLKDDHPDLYEFITAKAETERLLHKLREAGEDVSDLGHPIYELVPHQQANRAVRLSDQFMQAVERDELWPLFSRYWQTPTQHVRAREALSLLAWANWRCGDPGVQFTQTINDWHTIPDVAPINCSNPCSEFMFIDDSACNLASLNLLKFYNERDGTFDLLDLQRTTHLVLQAQDNLVDIAFYPTEKIKENAVTFRPIGLGITNLGGLLMAMGIPYASPLGRLVASSLMGFITLTAYAHSMRLARKKGTYLNDYLGERDPMYRVLERHLSAFKELPSQFSSYCELPFVQSLCEAIIDLSCRFERLLQSEALPRNAQVSLIAPTGTISFVMDAATTGVEPVYDLTYKKRLVGENRTLTIVVPTLERGLISLGYAPYECRLIRACVEKGQPFAHLLRSEAHAQVFATAHQIAPEDHIAMVGALTPFLSGAVSKTVNLPSQTTKEEIENLIKYAWRSGLKAITFYREGSKASQPLSAQARVPSHGAFLCANCQTSFVPTGTCWTCPVCGEGGICS